MPARFAAVAIAGCLAVLGCDIPTAPTPSPVTTADADRPTLPAPVVPTIITRPLDLAIVHPLFEDRFWQELAFFQFDEPGTLEQRFTRPYPGASPNIYVWLQDDNIGSGPSVVRPEWREAIFGAVPRLAEQLTGRPYRGLFESGMEDRRRPGWITVRFTSGRHETVPHAAGWASVGDDPGDIWIRLEESGALPDGMGFFPHLFAHEFGHAMGLLHVGDLTAVMATSPGQTNASHFNEREQFHSQLLHEVGWGKRYCGWPFGPQCDDARPGRSNAFRVVVVVD